MASAVILLLACKTNNGKDLSLEYYNIANGFLELNRIDSAIEYYNKSLDVDYDNNNSRYNLVLAYVKSEEYDKALENVEILLLWDSRNSDLLSLKAFSLYSLGDLEGALDTYKDIDRLKIKDMDIKLKISKIYYQLEEFEKSLEYLEEILKDSSFVEGRKELYQMAGMLSKTLELNDDAVEYYNIFLENDGKNQFILRELLELYETLEDFDSEIVTIDILLEIEDIEDRGALYFRKGELFMYQNNFKKGYESLKLAKDEGFDDKERVDELLGTPDLVEEQKIRELFE